MPRVHRQLVVPQKIKPLPHDVGGKLSDLHVEAMAVVFGAQFLRPANPSNAAYVRAVERAIACTENARAGWLAVRTPQMPAGDREGAGKSAVALAGFALELDRLGDALRWLSKARKELGPAHKGTIAQNLDYVLAHVDEASNTALLRKVFEAWFFGGISESTEIDDTEALLQKMSLAAART
jgi:sugar phosphate isomerase/epimerase